MGLLSRFALIEFDNPDFYFQFFISKTFHQEVWKIFEGVGESDIIGDQDQIADDLVDICV